MTVIDTNVLIDLQGRSGKRLQAVAETMLRTQLHADEYLRTTCFNVAEIYVGLERSPGREAEREGAEEILAQLDILQFDSDAIGYYARIQARLLDAAPAGDMDMLIAATMLAHGENTIITRNKRHFERIPDIEVISY